MYVQVLSKDFIRCNLKDFKINWSWEWDKTETPLRLRDNLSALACNIYNLHKLFRKKYISSKTKVNQREIIIDQKTIEWAYVWVLSWGNSKSRILFERVRKFKHSMQVSYLIFHCVWGWRFDSFSFAGQRLVPFEFYAPVKTLISLFLEVKLHLSRI